MELEALSLKRLLKVPYFFYDASKVILTSLCLEVYRKEPEGL